MDELKEKELEPIEEKELEPIEEKPAGMFKALMLQSLGLAQLTPMNLTKVISTALRTSTGKNTMAAGKVATLYGNDDYYVSSALVSFLPVQDGTPTSDNPVSITGFTGAKLFHTKENLCGGDALNAEIQSHATRTFDATDRFVSFPATATGILIDGMFKENTQYTFILDLYKTAGTGSNMHVLYTDGTSTAISSVTAAQTKEVKVFTSAAGKTVQCVVPYNMSGTTRIYIDDSGIFEGVLTADDYVEYVGETITADWTADAGTVFGGTYDFASGKLISEWDEIASYAGEELPGEWYSSMDVYSEGGTPTTGAQVVYKLTEPVEYELDPEAIKLYFGENNLWSKIGPIEVIY